MDADADAVQWIHFIFRVSLYYFFGFQVHVTNMIRRVFVPVLVLYPAWGFWIEYESIIRCYICELVILVHVIKIVIVFKDQNDI